MSTSSASLTSSIHNTILATFAADSLSLGAHWEYSSEAIAKAFNGKVDRLHDPISNYHAGKTAGAQTHIGDNAILLLESMAASSPPSSFTVPQYIEYWRTKWDVDTPPAYVDHVTKDLLKGLKEGKPASESAGTDDDLSHSARFFPLLALYHDNEDKLAATAKQITTSFQSGADEASTSEWLSRVAYRVVVGKQKPSKAIEAVTAQLNSPFLNEAVKKGQATAKAAQSDEEALKSYGETKAYGDKIFHTGLTCGVKYGVPAVVHFVYKYEDAADPTVALIEDISSGGNSNARSLAIATLLFGYRGVEGFKVKEFIAGLKQREHIESLLTKLEAAQKK